MIRLTTTVRASEGIAIGRAFVVERTCREQSREKGTPEQEQQLFAAALAESREQIEALSENSDIFAAHLEIIDDPMLQEGVEAHIAEGMSADEAVKTAGEELVAMFEAIDDEYLAARSADIEDIFHRISANLTGGVENPFEGVQEGDIIIDRQLLPSDMAQIDFSKIRAFITAEGSATSHICIIARNLSVPAVVALEEILGAVKTGDKVIVDGSDGVVVVAPDAETLDSYLLKELSFKSLTAERERYATAEISVDGERVFVYANAGSVEEVESAINAGAEGIGLFRSEFIYMHSTTEPTEEEQYKIYSAAAKACGERPLTIRTLDIGGDKAVPYLGFPSEENPFLGWRAIRVSLDCREMFARQLRAILRASAEGNIRVMFPMITTLDELLEAQKLLEECKTELKAQGEKYDADIRTGVMIETPAAVFIAPQLAAHCDFFSIGTNDLVQYVMAADRANARVSRLYDPYSAAVTRAIEMTISAADAAGIECGMCGELASDTNATESLIAMHLREFSVGVGSIAKLKYQLNRLIYEK